MRLATGVLAAVLLLVGMAPSQAVVRIADDRGGIPPHEQRSRIPNAVGDMIRLRHQHFDMLGGKQVRLLQNVDNPAQFIQIIDYEIHQSFETSRQQIAGDPRLQTFLQAWRQMFPGTVEVDVFREVEA